MPLQYKQKACLLLVNETVGNLSSMLLTGDAINCVYDIHPGPYHIIPTGHESKGNQQKHDVHAAY